MRKYVVIGPARSGTTLTHLVLRGHPNVSALNDEVKIDAAFDNGISVFTHGNDTAIEKAEGIVRIFNLLALLNENNQTQAAGFKCAVLTFREAEIFANRVREYFPNLSIILTVREDLAAQYGSLQLASLSGRWHSWTQPKDQSPSTITIDPSHYRQYYLANRRIIGILRKLSSTHRLMEVSFEHDILPGLGFTTRLQEFLGLVYVEPTWVSAKKVSPPPEEYIVNYSEIKRLEITIQESQKPIAESANNEANRVQSRTEFDPSRALRKLVAYALRHLDRF